MLRSCKCFQHVSKMATLTCNRVNIVVIKSAIILNFMHITFNLCVKECHMHKNRGVRDGPESGWGKLLNWAGLRSVPERGSCGRGPEIGRSLSKLKSNKNKKHTIVSLDLLIYRTFSFFKLEIQLFIIFSEKLPK